LSEAREKRKRREGNATGMAFGGGGVDNPLICKEFFLTLFYYTHVNGVVNYAFQVPIPRGMANDNSLNLSIIQLSVW
jgi:hypothetical protein